MKIRGFRVELGEIESRLKQQPNVQDAIVHVNKANPQNPTLLAYVILVDTPSDNKQSILDQLKVSLKQQLPAHMVPTSIGFIDQIPLTPNGKSDYQALPEINPEKTRKASKRSARNRLEKLIAETLEQILDVTDISVNSHFFDDLGGNSLQMVLIHHQLESTLGLPVSLMDLFEYPTTQLLARCLSNSTDDDMITEPEKTSYSQLTDKQTVAIIGMAGRFPGANDVETFWNRIKEGDELIQHFSREELLEAGISPTLLDDPNYVKAKGSMVLRCLITCLKMTFWIL